MSCCATLYNCWHFPVFSLNLPNWGFQRNTPYRAIIQTPSAHFTLFLSCGSAYCCISVLHGSDKRHGFRGARANRLRATISEHAGH